EAREPPEVRGTGRDDVRLLVTRRDDDAVTHAHFRELPRFLRAGDLVVLNTTATLPAALTAIRDDGSVIALHVSTLGAPASSPADATASRAVAWDVWRDAAQSAAETAALHLVEPRKIVAREGEQLTLADGATCTLLARYRDSQRLWIARIDVPDL